MDERHIREMPTNMLTNLDADAEYELRHEDFVAEIPQSGERRLGGHRVRAAAVRQ